MGLIIAEVRGLDDLLHFLGGHDFHAATKAACDAMAIGPEMIESGAHYVVGARSHVFRRSIDASCAKLISTGTCTLCNGAMDSQSSYCAITGKKPSAM